jgi:hypothetical protein
MDNRRRFRAAHDNVRTGQQCDELAALHLRGHSITSSASASNLSGTSRPSRRPEVEEEYEVRRP